MALTFRLASAFLVSALAAGCNQSLFDASLGGGDPAGDGGPLAPDARPGGRDGGDDERDGGDDERDGAPDGRAACVINGSPSPPPLYVELSAGSGPAEEILMEETTWEGLPAWVAKIPTTETVRSVIVDCPAVPGSGACAGLPEGALLFVSTTDTHRPALRWTSPFSCALVDYLWLVKESPLPVQATLSIQENGVVLETRTLTELEQSDNALRSVDLEVGAVLHVIPTIGYPAGGRIGMRINFLERSTP